ncbi:MAG: peptidylprolyl isomerase [Chloroflexia bacterium]
MHSRHILVTEEATAREVLNKLKAGQKFETLARQYSLDESNKLKGGDLGWATQEVYDPAFAKAAFALRTPGQLSPAVNSSFGWHIIQLIERDEQRPVAPEQMAQIGEQALTTYIAAQRKQLQDTNRLNISIPATPTAPVQTPGPQTTPTAVG